VTRNKMTAKKPTEKSKATVDPSKRQGELKPFGGSKSDEWNSVLVYQTFRTLFVFENSDEETKKEQRTAALAGLIGIKPRDELEGMIAAQLVACHNASMECYRRAMLREQTFDGRHENLNQANKLSRTYSTLLETLNRHRGKGQQQVRVEHVHVHEGGQAIVGNVETKGGGVSKEIREQPHALAYAPSAPMLSPNAQREAVPVARDAERPVPDARRDLNGRAEGK
jgi:hypothetical protein